MRSPRPLGAVFQRLIGLDDHRLHGSGRLQPGVGRPFPGPVNAHQGFEEVAVGQLPGRGVELAHDHLVQVAVVDPELLAVADDQLLKEWDRKEWREYFDKLLNGEAWIENRMMLRAEHWRAGDAQGAAELNRAHRERASRELLAIFEHYRLVQM